MVEEELHQPPVKTITWYHTGAYFNRQDLLNHFANEYTRGPHEFDLPEVQLRVGVRSEDRSAVERFTKEIAPLVLTGPPGVTGFAGGRPKVEEIVAYWPALIPKSEITANVNIIEV